MKVILIVLAAVCALWVLFLLVVPVNLPPPFQLWSHGAIESAEKVIADSGAKDLLDGTPLTVSRGTLIILTKQAKQPDERKVQVQLYRRASMGFAMIAAVSLYALSRRQSNEKTTSA